jgi:L-rhamnose-H+ transport protein
MGVLWMGANATYGVASVFLGSLGTSVGWGLYQIFMIMTASIAGVVTGEWRQAPAGALRTLWAGLALLALATALISAGNTADPAEHSSDLPRPAACTRGASAPL